MRSPERFTLSGVTSHQPAGRGEEWYFPLSHVLEMHHMEGRDDQPDIGFGLSDVCVGFDIDPDEGGMREAQMQLGHGSMKMTEHYVRSRRGEKVTPTK